MEADSLPPMPLPLEEVGELPQNAPAAEQVTARPLARLREVLVRGAAPPLVGAATLTALSASGAGALTFAVALAAFSAGLVVARPPAASPGVETLADKLRIVGAAVLGGVALALLGPVAGLVPTSALAVVAGTLTTALVCLAPASRPARPTWRPSRTIRTAVIGSPHSATSLVRELRQTRRRRYQLVGRIVPVDEDAGLRSSGEVSALGSLDELGRVVAAHHIDLLVMTSEVPRLEVFDEVARSCGGLSVRLWELSGFYEALFGHVPVTEINAAWFQYILHPKFRHAPPRSKRVLDLSVVASVGVVVLPVMLVLATLIRRDGGPALFRQQRIGQGGRPFTLYKLRSMRVETTPAAQWASEHDPRITRLGRFLRRSHLDEFPQLINVVLGEMTLVGPRPEQPSFVERLEQGVPFYDRRHLLKPGITGWAQLRCGYAGSDIGSVWKLCHDLYYLKHRSMKLDLAILVKTALRLFHDRQYGVESTISPKLIKQDAPASGSEA